MSIKLSNQQPASQLAHMWIQ